LNRLQILSEHPLKGESFISRNVFKKAAELIEFGAVIDALKIVDNAKI
jgi:hypothetical protein